MSERFIIESGACISFRHELKAVARRPYFLAAFF
jgi:hypothetical protein